MSGPAEFLAARLDEEEASAQMAMPGWPPKAVTKVAYDPEHYAWMPTDITPSKAFHILRHGPARSMHEIAADRRLLDEYGKCAGDKGWDDALEFAVRCRASAWCDHPDYLPEWKP